MKKDHIFLMAVVAAGLLIFSGCSKKVTAPEENLAAPALSSPSDSLVIVDATYIPDFDWDDVSGASAYELVVEMVADSSSSFSNPQMVQTGLTNSDYTASGTFPDATYYWKVRCKDTAGNWSGWSETWSFILLTTITDIDGNDYKLVKIGDQIWTAENLKVTHYRNGDAIPNETGDEEWCDLLSGAYCNYDNDEIYMATYGRLYNWLAVNDSRNIAIAGWHVPTDEEWKELEMYLGMSQSQADDVGYRGSDEGGKMKETGTTHWNSPNEGATNESGFTALPGGYRTYGAGHFVTMGNLAYFWSSTEGNSNEAWFRVLDSGTPRVSRYSDNKCRGVSIRLVRD
jgi:uncharacterized protein (TIGR02145 family)